MTIIVIDSQDVPNPESRAVLQALSSRSLKPIMEQVDVVNKDKTEAFIKSNVIGYNHSSVLDAADSVIVNFTNISMLAAKAIEDVQLFKGTESSTRYIDFATQEFKNPLHRNYEIDYENVHKMQRKFYVEGFKEQLEYMREKYPRKPEENETVYERAIKAKTFDIMRAFLPCGATTQVNWVTDLRTVIERVHLIEFHTLQEVRDLAIELKKALSAKYPSSCVFSRNEDIENHLERFKDEYSNYAEDPQYCDIDTWDHPVCSYQKINITFNKESLEVYKENYPSLQNRPKGCPLPKMYGNNFAVAGLIDFGSFRDLQRHRNNICKIPLVSMDYGFEQWYLDQLSPEMQVKAQNHLDWVYNELTAYPINIYNIQYFIPMGYRVPFLLEMGLAQMVYIAELRSSKYVHPTARIVALSMADFLAKFAPFVKTYIDRSTDDFYINRGNQTIITNPEEKA